MTRRSGSSPRAKTPRQETSNSTDAVQASRVEAVPAPKPASQDVVLVTGPTDDGKGMNVLRAKDDTLQIGAMRPLEEGKPILGELVKLKPRTESPALFDVETHLPNPVQGKAKRSDPSARPTSAGPAQVATDTYRTGWDRIYRRSGKKSLPN